MKRPTREELAARCEALDRENAAQGFALRCLAADASPDGTERFTVEGERHTFYLFGSRRSDGGTLVRVVVRPDAPAPRWGGPALPDVSAESFDRAHKRAAENAAACPYPLQFKTRDALDRLCTVRNSKLLEG